MDFEAVCAVVEVGVVVAEDAVHVGDVLHFSVAAEEVLF
jgi:hypothetical protein